MKIAIIGASGYTGRPTVELALKKGYQVIAVSRNGKFEAHPLLNVIHEDINNYQNLKEMLKDADVIISALNVSIEVEKYYDKYLESSNAAIKLAKELDKRIIIVGGASSLYVMHSGSANYFYVPEDFQKIVKGAYDLYHQIKSDLTYNWTFISPALELVDELALNNYNIGGDYTLFNSKGESKVSIHDLADLILTEAKHNISKNRRITLANR